jgi:hypothetical protein
MSAANQAFEIFAGLALSAPYQNVEACLSVAMEGDAEEGDLCEWTRSPDALADGFQSQGDGVLLVRSTDSEGKQKILGEFVFMDQGGELEELLVDYSANDYSERVVQVWTEKVTGGEW